MKKTVLITGINGFLGSYLAKKLSKQYRIIGVEYQTVNLFRLEGCNFKVVQSTHADLEILFKEEQIDFIIHTATFYGRDNEDVEQITQSNLFTPFFLLNIAIKNKVKAFINTDTVLDRFLNVYALTKNQFRDWLYFRRNEIKVINMQLEHFYGAGCNSSNFIISMIKRLKQNEPSIDLTKGEQRRDFIYYEDVIDAFELVVSKIDEISTSYADFQVASGEDITIKELLLYLKEQTNSKSILNFGAVPYRENELMVSESNIAPLVKLGWKPKYSIKRGLLKTIKKE